MNLKKLLFLFVFISINKIANAQLTISNLPIIKITTLTPISTNIQQGNIDIIDNLSGINNITDIPTYSGMIGVKLRGISPFPKKSYSVETWSATNISLDTAIMGMNSENDWVLLAAYSDRSFTRNILSSFIYGKMGYYSPHYKHCEVLINGVYAGIYLFGEKIKRNINRLDISKLTIADNFGVDATGGYILKLDDEVGGWNSMIPPPNASAGQFINYLYSYPDAGTITPAQAAYIKSYVDSFENAMNGTNFQDTISGWRNFAGNGTFINYMILCELTKNVESYRTNQYLYKDKLKKLKPAGPWSFDLAFHNTSNCFASMDTGWCYNFNANCSSDPKQVPFYWKKFTQDTLFMRELKCAYKEHRMLGNILDTAVLFQKLDSMNNRLNAPSGGSTAIARNFTLWPIWGVNTANEPLPMATNYAQELMAIKNFITARITFLDAQWSITPARCGIAVNVNQYNDLLSQVHIYPNPTSDKISLNLLSIPENTHLQLIDMHGRILFKDQAKAHTVYTFSTEKFSKGIYFLQLKSNTTTCTKKIILN